MLILRSLELEDKDVVSLVRRHELVPKLLRHKLEEQIVELVPIADEYIFERRQEMLGEQDEAQYLISRGWTTNDFEFHIRRAEAMKLFSEHQFGPALEELFLTSSAERDTIIYSLLRVKDAFLARELWIRLEENEITFAEAAATYGEGPEASSKGVIGPLPIGRLLPSQLGEMLRRLQPGEIAPPQQLGEWVVLLRLEKLTSARFDEEMREQLLNEQLEEFLAKRVEQLLDGEQVDPLHYDP
ncbi:peptidylprolyl isomerase [Prochlorococcus sp. MIT 1300]|uniref:peptidylprolyl isomerase n=1 Tax=Prochlorococcus sp. MIT 1300 TaxID=3096218 RepID=UPI002A752F08|nr:peptidylprolyl isomerase [Prochlorococcus sp. MIT 1300]